MAKPRIARELQESLRRAFERAHESRHEYVTLEHLLRSLVDDPRAGEAIEACGGSRSRLRRKLDGFLESSAPILPEGEQADPQQTLAVERVLQNAAIHALSSEMSVIDGANVLVQLLKEEESHAVFFLQEEGLSSFALKQFVSHGIGPGANSGSIERVSENEGEGEEDDDEDGGGSAKDPLEAYTTDLVAEAEAGRIDPLVGRALELERTIQILCRRRKNNPIYVGEPGVGKTAIAEGLALRIFEKKVPEVLADARVYSLDMGSLLAGTKFRGQFEERLKGVMKRITELPNAILFIDEIHTIVGAGATSGGSMDASNILKPALSSGKLRCIGSTTYADYKHLERDRALARRLQKIDVLEPTVDETVEILRGLAPKYEAHHGVTYDADAIEACARLAAKHIVDRHLPDKAIDVLDETGSYDRMRPEAERAHRVTVKDVERVVSKMARVPVEAVETDERARMRELEPALRQVIFGQDDAIENLVSSIVLSRAGLRAVEKPIGNFLFAGPTGVGKTELAKQLAKTLGVELLRFDMSEYGERHTVSRLIGAPPGYVGFDQGGLLTDAVRKHPHSVVILDEIEKAHPEIFNILLQVMDHAKLTDNNGREADFRNVILVLTTNAGAFESQEKVVGFGNTAPGIAESRSKAAIERTFTPEFRNRIDAIVYFKALSKEVIRKVVDKEVRLLEEALSPKRVRIELTDEAREWLAENGYDARMGARPMSRLIERELKKPVARALVFGDLSEGGTVSVTVLEGKIALVYTLAS